MSLPNPTYPLDDSCSVIHNGTLFSYTATAFQGLPLQKGAKWLELPVGVGVRGGVCVLVTPVNDPASTALFVVGGQTNWTEYQGLQRFMFSKGKWETIIPTDPVMQNRIYHGAAYLNSSNSILIYSGTQGSTEQFSTQTFTIKAIEPFQVTAYQSIAPPAISPMLLPWSDSQAVFVGGNTTNTKVMLFEPTTSWVDSNVTLANPIYSIDSIKSIIIKGDDSSKSLYTFDPTVSPNEVNLTLLVDASGNPIKNSQPNSIVGTKDSAKKDGDLTMNSWPAYNNSLAPLTMRNSYALSQDPSGLVVISGGNEEDLLCVFKARDNSWEDATDILGTSDSIFSSSLSPPTSLSKATGSVPASTDPTSPSPLPAWAFGAILGSVIVSMLIIIALLMLCKWRKRRRQSRKNDQNRRSYKTDEKDGMDFMDKDDPSMLSINPDIATEPQSSIFFAAPPKKGAKKDGRSSYQSYKTSISKPLAIENMIARKDMSFERPGPVPPRGEKRGNPERSSGWNPYRLADNNPYGTASGPGDSNSNLSRSSDFSDGSASQDSLHINSPRHGERPGIHDVRLQSPTVAHHPHHHPSRGEISGRSGSPGSDTSNNLYNDDHYVNYLGDTSGHDPDRWTPIEEQSWGQNQGNYSNRNPYGNQLNDSIQSPSSEFYSSPKERPVISPSKNTGWFNKSGNATRL